MSILLSFGLSSQFKSNWSSWILTGGFVVFTLIYLLLPQFHREDWKRLVKNLPKDRPVYMIKASSDPVSYYDNNLTVRELYGLTGSPPFAKASGGRRVNELDQEIIVIPYTSEIYGLDYKDLLTKNGYLLKKEVSFREVTYEKWSLTK